MGVGAGFGGGGGVGEAFGAAFGADLLLILVWFTRFALASSSAIKRFCCCSSSVSVDCIIGCAGVGATTFGSAFALALPLAFGDLDLGALALGGPSGVGKAACGVASSMTSSAMGLLLDL